MPKRDLLIVTLFYISLCVLYYVRMILITEPGFPLDDAWIHQVFARNIATGHGFSFNPDIPVAGSTAPLWTLILAIPWMIFGPVTGGIITGILCQWLALIAIYKLTEILTKDRALSLLVAISSVLCWPLIWGALSGMEAGLYSALSLWGLYFYFRSESLGDARDYLAYGLFGLASLSRPECALFIVAALIRDAAVWWKSTDRGYLPWLVKVGILAILAAPYFTLTYINTGGIFPRTFGAKVRNDNLIASLLQWNWKAAIKASTVLPYFYIQNFYRHILLLNPIIAYALFTGLLKLVRASRGEKSKTIMLALLFISYVPLMGIIAPVFAATVHNFRMIDHLLFLFIMIGISGLFMDVETESPLFRKILSIGGIIFLSIGISFNFMEGTISSLLNRNSLLFSADDLKRILFVYNNACIGTRSLGIIMITSSLITIGRIRKFINTGFVRPALISAVLITGVYGVIRNADLYANNVRNINECDVYAAKYLGDIARPGDFVAVNDIGAMGYYSKMEILDLKGLISPEITVAMVYNDSLAYELMLSQKTVDYVAILPNWFDYLPSRSDNFLPIARFGTKDNTIVAGDTTVVYKACWPDSTMNAHRVADEQAPGRQNDK